MFEKTDLNEILNNFELVGLERLDGEFEHEGKVIPYKNYRFKIKNKYNSLVITCKVDKVFKDYIEEKE